MAKIILGAASKFFFALGTGLLLSCTRWTSLDSTQGHRVQVHEHEHLPGQGGHELKFHRCQEILIVLCHLAPPPITALWRKPHWKWEIKEFAKMTTSPPIFGRYELFQIEYLDTTVGQFHFLAYIWSELIIQRRQTFLIALFSWSSSRLAEECEKSEGTTWTDS